MAGSAQFYGLNREKPGKSSVVKIIHQTVLFRIYVATWFTQISPGRYIYSLISKYVMNYARLKCYFLEANLT